MPKRRKNSSFLKRWILLSLLLVAAYWLAKELGLNRRQATTWTHHYLRGVDVSRYQGTINWARLKEEEVKFAFIKATEGRTLLDRQFKRNWEQAKKQGILRGAYHFYIPSIDAAQQAENFLKHVKIEKGDLPPVLDVEVHKGQSKALIRQGVLKWMKIVEKRTGVRPILYTMPKFADNYLGDDLKNYPLWLASWRKNSPRMPKAWSKWSFWQFTEKGRVSGVNSTIDLNYFVGSLKELKAFCKR